MKLRRWTWLCRAVLLHTALLACVCATAAQDGGARATRIADVVVQTQDHRELHFYSDLVAGRLVAINFIFTGCGTVCPIMGAGFARLQHALGARAPDVSLLSVSLDPLNDTPDSLAQWSRRFGAQPGWTLVTGNKPEIDRLLRSLGASAADPGSHAPLVLIIDDRHGSDWRRLDGLTDPETLARILLEQRAHDAARDSPATGSSGGTIPP